MGGHPGAEDAGRGEGRIRFEDRVCMMLDGNPVTQARLEAAGVTVRTFPGQDLCLKGGGGPTCLTRPIWREATDS